MRKKIISLILATAISVSMVACGSTKAPTEDTTAATDTTVTTDTTTTTEPTVERDTFTMAINYMPDNLKPDFASDDYTTIVRPIYDVLFAESADGLEFYLADKFEMADDGVTYTLHIREDANWSDGVPVTVDDILFTEAYTMAKNGRSSYSTVSGQPVTFNKIDDKTLEIVLPVPYNYYATSLSRMPIFPSHVFDNDAQKLVDDISYYTDPAMVTSGAYTVKEINADSIVFEARDDYYRGTPSVKTIVAKVVGSAKEIAFENGEIDYMRITTVDALEKYSAQPDKYNIFSVSESRLNYLQVNPYGPAQLNDEQREALFYAINGDEVIAGAYGSTELAQNPNSLLTPDMALYNPETEDYVYDLDKAKELAKSSGLEGMTLTYIYNSDRANMEECAVVLQQQLAQIGVNLQIEAMDSSSFFPRFFAVMYGSGQETTWDLGTNGWDSMRGNTMNQSYSYFNQAKNAWGLTPTCGELALAVNTCPDLEEAKVLADKAVETALAQHYIYPLTYTNYVMVSQKYVGGLDCSAIVPEFIDWLGISVNN